MSLRFLVYVLLIILFMSRCVVYQPQMVDLPLINKKKDARLDLGVSPLSGSAFGTFSYGLTNVLSVQGFGNIGLSNRYYLQGAAGLYKNFGKSGVCELYAGYGTGYGSAYNSANPGHLYGKYQLYFGQFNIGQIAIEDSNHEFAFGIKSGYFTSALTDEDYYSSRENPGQAYPDNPEYDIYKDESVLIEPIVTFKAGRENLRFTMRLSYAGMIKYTNLDKNYSYYPFNVGAGINYRF